MYLSYTVLNPIIIAILIITMPQGVSCQKSCTGNAGLMKSIQYQLKLVEANDGKCDCAHRSLEKVGFFVSSSGALENVGTGAIVIYDSVTTNLGGGYDKSTGVFSAPVEGLYYFTWTVLAQEDKSFYTQLNLNNTVVAKNHAGANGISTHMSSSQSAVIQIQKNDGVSIRVHSGGKYMYGDKWSTFSGFKI
ncbi:C1QL [Mytilus coruscus]|uniref:C1QL n=1 Tax=Mytilus coruscus TaxID=42192 RepID=A0A6J7ZZ84_MYTCO|nr:C1QL [Mytilus coruscus]